MRIAIIEDESMIRNIIKGILGDSGIGFSQILEADSVKTGVAVLRQNQPDVVLLDIRLGDGTGFDILTELGNPNFKIIFITAYDQFALKAIKFSAFDYILKPVDPDGLVASLKRAAEQVGQPANAKQMDVLFNYLQNKPGKEKKIALNTQESIRLVKLGDIVRCLADSNYTTVFLKGKNKVLVSRPLKEFEELLSGHGFFRTHQSHIANMDYITSYEKKDGGFLLMEDGSQVPVSKRKKEQLLVLLKKL